MGSSEIVADGWQRDVAARNETIASLTHQVAELRAELAAQTVEGMLREFHAELGVHEGWMPKHPTADVPPSVLRSRRALLDEELGELERALAARSITKIADALADLVYVLAGTAVVHGLPFDALLAEVHRSNITKTNEPGNPKLVKGPGYIPPDIARVLWEASR